ncbi:MAG TPA: hypothetical protein VFN63_14020 [Pseudolabrys sp.]|nr:hypothetical protein [Pseudolabrys sp.]
MPSVDPPAKQAQGPRAPGWLSTIRARLYLAFGFAAALTIIGASVAFYEFTIIGSTTNEIVSRSLPATAVSLRLAEQASSLVSSGPRLMNAGTEKVRAEILADINKQEKNLEDGISQLKALGIGNADDIEVSRKALAQRLQTLNQAISNRISMSNERSYLASSIRAAHEALLIGLAPAIDDANFDLMMNARQEGAAAIGTRLEYLRRLLETESESNLLAGLLTEASLVSDASRLEPLRDLIASAQRKIAKNLNAIPDQAQHEKLAALYKQLGAIGADDGIIAARAYELNQQHEAQVAFTAAQKDASRLKHAVDALVEQQGSTAQQISGYASSQISSGKLILTALSIAAVLGAALIAWLYVGRSVARRLGFLSERCGAWPVAMSPSISRTPVATRSETWGGRFCFSARQRPTWQARVARKASRRERWNRADSSSRPPRRNSSGPCPISFRHSTVRLARWTRPRAKWRTAPAEIRSRRLRPRQHRSRQRQTSAS